MKTFKEIVGQRMRKRRKELGLSQQALADKMDVKRERVSDWERGIHEPKGGLRATLLRLLKSSEENIFGADAIDRPAPARLAEPSTPYGPETVADMTPAELEALVARASKRDGAINMEIERLKKEVERLKVVPEDVVERWEEADEEIQLLCLYLLTGKDEYFHKVPAAAWKRLQQLGVSKRPPKGRALKPKE